MHYFKTLHPVVVVNIKIYIGHLNVHHGEKYTLTRYYKINKYACLCINNKQQKTIISWKVMQSGQSPF